MQKFEITGRSKRKFDVVLKLSEKIEGVFVEVWGSVPEV